MKNDGPSRARTLLLALAVLALMVGHVVALHRFASRVALPAVLIVLIVVVVMVQHLGLFKRRF